MAMVKYEVVQHDGGWAYRVEGSYSETFKSHEAALAAARRAAGEQRVAGDTVGLVYEDAQGLIREELSDGDDRPETEIEDR